MYVSVFFFYFILCSFFIVVQVQLPPFSHHHFPPPHPPPPPTLNPSPTLALPMGSILYTCSLTALPKVLWSAGNNDDLWPYVFLYCRMILLLSNFSGKVNLAIRSTEQYLMSLSLSLSLSLFSFSSKLLTKSAFLWNMTLAIIKLLLS